ncbi:MAG: DUF4395 domain-containing protein [Actinomycetales bacterium]|nr:DUF4395 domain-containing protein [Actinomycetales bacterium]
MDLRPGFPQVVDDVTVRLVATIVLIVGIVALVFGAWWLYAVLAVDFVLRSIFGPRLSPLAQVVLRLIRPAVPAQPRPTAGPPKRFVASIGAVLTTAATGFALVATATGSSSAATAVFAIGAVMVVFPALEAVAGLCIGCVVFAQLIRLGWLPERVCLECADINRRVGLPQVARS